MSSLRFFGQLLSLIAVASAAGTFFQLSDLANDDFPYSVGSRANIAVFLSSATSDPNLLRKVIASSRDGNTASLLELKNMKIFKNSDKKYGWSISGPVHFRTSDLTKDQLRSLNGVVYVVDVDSAYNYLSVYDVTQNNTIVMQNTLTPQTVVILNTNDQKSNQFTNWKQQLGQSVRLSINDDDKTLIFRNPLSLAPNSALQFAYNVDPFCIDSQILIGEFQGAVQFSLSPGFLPNDIVSTASGSSTTGLISKTFFDDDDSKSVTFSGDGNVIGFSGFNIFASPDQGGVIQTDLISDHVDYSKNITSIGSDSFLLRKTSKKLQVNSRQGGQFYIQYYNIETGV